MRIIDAAVVSHTEVARNVYELVLQGDLGLKPWYSGQFVQVMTPKNAGYLRRPFSIVSVSDDCFVLVYRVEGVGTQAMCQLEPGELLNVMGPLGNTFPCVKNKDVALIGGGIGVVPLYGLAKGLIENGCRIHAYLGYQDEASIIYQSKFEALGTVTLATMDGSKGTKGSILDAAYSLEETLIFACGPNGLLGAIQNQFKDRDVYLSLEARMACGYGVCNACVCKTQAEKTALICKDGPVFNGKEVEL